MQLSQLQIKVSSLMSLSLYYLPGSAVAQDSDDSDIEEEAHVEPVECQTQETQSQKSSQTDQIQEQWEPSDDFGDIRTPSPHTKYKKSKEQSKLFY